MPARVNTILVITNIPTPYRIPLFNELDRLLDENGMKLKLVFAALGYSRRKWRIDMGECRFDYEVLHSHAFRVKGSKGMLFTNPGIFAFNAGSPRWRQRMSPGCARSARQARWPFFSNVQRRPGYLGHAFRTCGKFDGDPPCRTAG